MRKNLPFLAGAAASTLLPLVLIGGFVLWGTTSAPAVAVRFDLLQVTQHRFQTQAAAIGPGAHLLDDPRSADLYHVDAAAHGFWSDGTSVLLLGGGRPGGDILDQFEDRLDPVSRWADSAGEVQSRGFNQGDGVQGRAYAAGPVAIVLMGPDPAAVAAHASALPAFPPQPANLAAQLLSEHTIPTIAAMIALVLLWSLLQIPIWRRLAPR